MTDAYKNIISSIAALVLASVIVLGFDVDLFSWIEDPQTVQPAATTTAKAVNVIDGDTFNARVGSTTESVRLIGIDSPEITWPNDENELAEPAPECYGFEARDELRRLVADREVVLVGDKLQPTRDDYDRRLAYVYTDGELVNEALLAGGFARELTVGPGYEKQEAFRKASAEAQQSLSGLWAACE